MGRGKRLLARSLYLKTVFQLTGAILAVFLVLLLVNYSFVSSKTLRQQADKLLNAAQAVSGTIAIHLNEEGDIDNRQVSSYVNFSARSTGALVWVVNHQGDIIMHTGIPATVIQRLERSDRGYYRLDAQHRYGQRAGTSGMSMTGDFDGLFEASKDFWLSVAYPIPAGNLGYRGEIQIHYPQQTPSFATFLTTSELAISFVIAFAFALLINGILSRTITRPIRLLSEAVNKVARGDLSARVESIAREPVKNRLFLQTFVSDDLTTLVRTINDMIEKMANQERDRKDFISSVSHDLRTPITSIRGFVEGMLDGTIAAEQYGRYLGIVKQEAVRLQALVQTMFEGTVLETDFKLNQTVFDINHLIREDLVGLQPLLAEKHLEVRTDFLKDEQGQLLVVADREAISRVIYNIVSNAIRFAPQDGLIALATGKTGRPKEIEVTVDDNGPGIAEDEQAYVFDRFYKVDKSRTAKGSGLGLYICRTLLAAHGQAITVSDSNLGGARFTFTLRTP